jgi:hypothetical protein
MDLDTAYRTLKLTPPVSWATARSAWRKMAGRLHPDRGGDPTRFREAREAWEQVDAALSSAPRASSPSTPPVPELNLGTPLVLRELRLDGLRIPAKGTACLILADEVLLQVDLEAPIDRLGSWFEATLLHSGIPASIRGPIVSSSQARPRRGVPTQVTAFWVRPAFGAR